MRNSGSPQDNSVRRRLSNLQDSLEWQLSRRTVLKSALGLGVGLPLITGLLAACGDDDETTDDEEDDEPDDVEEPAGEDEPDDEDDEEPEEPDEEETEEPDEDEPEEDDEPADDGSPTQGGTLRYGIVRSPTNIDPHFNDGSSSWNQQANVYDRLVDYDAEGELGPSLAESWEIEDDRIYRFELRQGVVFHHGGDFTADDVVFTIDRILDPETGAALEPDFSQLTSYEALDEFTVEMSLEEPFAPFLEVLANWAAGIVSREFSEDGVDYTEVMNGTGAFMQDEYELDVHYQYVRNPNYWKEGLPYLDGLDIRPLNDESGRVAALRSGDVDFIAYCPWQVVEELEQDPNFEVAQSFFLFNHIKLNPQEPPLDDQRVRQALSYAIDREMVDNIAFGGLGLVRTGGFMPPDSPFYNEDLEGYYDYDPDRALELLAEAGYEDPGEIQLTMHSLVGPHHMDSAEVVAQQWRDLGIQVELLSQDSATLPERRFSGDYQVMMDGVSPPYGDPGVYNLFFMTGGSQYAATVNYSNPELDEVLLEGSSSVDMEARREAYRRAEEILLEDVPIIFLEWRPQFEAMASYVNGYAPVPNLSARAEAYHERTWMENDG